MKIITNNRNNISEWTSAEWAIYDAVTEIEKLGADTLLTDAVILLNEAQQKVAEYIIKNKL